MNIVSQAKGALSARQNESTTINPYLLIVSPATDLQAIFSIAAPLARNTEIPLLIICVGDDPDSTKDEDILERRIQSLFVKDDLDFVKTSYKTLTALDPCKSYCITDTASDIRRTIMPVFRSLTVDTLIIPFEVPLSNPTLTETLHWVFAQAPCTAALIQLQRDIGSFSPQKILVPVAGGQHSTAALKLSQRLGMLHDAIVTTLYVSTDDSDVAIEVGAERLKKMVDNAGLDESIVDRRIEAGTDVEKVILKTAEEGYEAIVLGDSNAGILRRLFFGSITKHLLRDATQSVLIVHGPKPAWQRARNLFERWLDVTVPQLDREHRISLVSQIESGSHWNFDFLALIVLSTTIAAFGLVQNSTAVVIGAMLVAPLMTPLLGSGLAIVQGNAPLFKRSINAVFAGFLVALGIGVAVGLLSGVNEATTELLGRTAPSLLDIFVALLSGVAAAYCTARPGLSAALPGVAIAAALVPPIATTGIMFSIGAWHETIGAAQLFCTNVVAIVLGAALNFYSAGIRPQRTNTGVYLKKTLFAFIMVALLLTVSLTPILFTARARALAAVQEYAQVKGKNINDLLKHKQHRLTDIIIKTESGRFQALVTIEGPRPVRKKLGQQVTAILKDERPDLSVLIKSSLVRSYPGKE